MLAIIKTGGKQYFVQKGDEIKIEKIEGEKGDEIEFDRVLLLAEKKNKNKEPQVKIGQPLVKGAQVKAEILEQGRHPKQIVFKYKPKKRYKKKRGHRQPYTKVKILEI